MRGDESSARGETRGLRRACARWRTATTTRAGIVSGAGARRGGKWARWELGEGACACARLRRGWRRDQRRATKMTVLLLRRRGSIRRAGRSGMGPGGAVRQRCAGGHRPRRAPSRGWLSSVPSLERACRARVGVRRSGLGGLGSRAGGRATTPTVGRFRGWRGGTGRWRGWYGGRRVVGGGTGVAQFLLWEVDQLRR